MMLLGHEDVRAKVSAGTSGLESVGMVVYVADFVPSRQSLSAKLSEDSARALRASGKKATANYKVADVDDLYEEVDDEQCKKLIRDRLDQDDFVVDDNGEGYADDGREEWDREPAYESDSQSDGGRVARGYDVEGRPLWLAPGRMYSVA
ncbi:DNA polymerase alpha subunit p180 N terminal-domain-containing protein [Podospora conica]|nr:DNA polymerase alpha subunit p180 N terminal-domain-containing protein [Schizothecium conicum]